MHPSRRNTYGRKFVRHLHFLAGEIYFFFFDEESVLDQKKIKHTHTHTHTHIRNLAAHPGANTTQRICTVPTYSCWQKRRISFFCLEGLYALDAAGQKQNNVNMNDKIKTRVKTQNKRPERK